MSVHAPASLLIDAAQRQLTLGDEEISTFAESVKFAECVPRGLLTRTIVSRNFETIAALGTS
jgi:ATP-dependent Lhr-like helicase